jgi:hypothetical protein
MNVTRNQRFLAGERDLRSRQRFYVVMDILLEPGAGEPVDIVFERTEIGSGVLRVREPVVWPMIIRLFSDRLEDHAFR